MGNLVHPHSNHHNHPKISLIIIIELKGAYDHLGRECRNRRRENLGIAKKGGGSDPCQDFLVDL